MQIMSSGEQKKKFGRIYDENKNVLNKPSTSSPVYEMKMSLMCPVIEPSSGFCIKLDWNELCLHEYDDNKADYYTYDDSVFYEQPQTQGIVYFSYVYGRLHRKYKK